MRKAKSEKTAVRERAGEVIRLELAALSVLLLSVVTLGQFGAVGRALTYLCRVLVGTWNFVLPLVGIAASLYAMVRLRWPTGLTRRRVGLLLLFGCLLIGTHIQLFDALSAGGRFPPSIVAETAKLVWAERNSDVPTDIGGGMVGAVGLALLIFLFDREGTPVVLAFLFLVALLLSTGLTFARILQSINAAAKRFRTEVRNWAVQQAGQWRTRGRTFSSLRHRLARKRGEGATPEDGVMPTGKGEGEAAAPPLVIHDFADVAYRQEALRFPEPEESAPEGSPEQRRGHTPPSGEGKTAGPTDPAREGGASTGEGEGHTPPTAKPQTPEEREARRLAAERYQLPPFSLLQKGAGRHSAREHRDIAANARKLEETLESFGVSARVISVHRGPAVTRYEVQPSIGVKVSRIVSLADDLALALAARDIRIEAPIPGKSAIGIEVPNNEIALVTLREVLESAAYHESPSKLTIALGRDISGEPVVADLSKMPHLLIAGATGSGKSVCINSIVVSLLYKAKPHEVKLMMIDPKMVELTVYNGIPHLLTPVVTDPRRAAQALKNVVREMERRYQLFAEKGARDIHRYNQLVADQEGGLEPALPQIVVIVDELADLMMVAPGDVEDAICRLAQMARAAGIHLIIATQRPSVDVITGVIKANIPSRIAFGVSSQADSRTILDMAGAEKLLGRGDMLFLPVGAPKPIRVQGAFVSDSEVEAVASFVRTQQEPQYVEEMIPTPEKEGELTFEDDLYEQAVQLVIEAQSASVSMLQRRLRIGYARAARLIDMMEANGIVGPYEGSKPREVLIKKGDTRISS
ncbi:MAG TPA: DNA translocase FtsK [Calditerricola sp.]